jgi:hypothetical protein
MQQSKAYVIKNQSRNLKAAIAARKAEYAAYRYGSKPYARAVTLPRVEGRP